MTEPAVHRPDAAAAGRRVRILVVDDSDVTRSHVMEMLRQLDDVELIAVESGVQGVRAIREGGISLVVCDYEMPDLSGLQVLRFARQAHSALELPVLMLTSREESEIKVKAFRAGANDYIPKQAQPEELLARVRTQLELLHMARQLADARASQAEQQKFELIGSLAEGFAHELNTPAQYLQDNLAFLAESFDGLKSIVDRLEQPQAAKEEMQRIDYSYVAEEVPRCLTASRQGVEHIAHVVSVMREFVRAGEQRPNRQSLNELVQTAIEVTRGQWHHVAELEVNLEEALPPIECVATTIKQVVLCALMNAVRALARSVSARDKGLLRIRTSHDALGWVTLEISDNGRGLDSELVQRALLPALGERLDDTAALGLAQARRVIVEQHRGQLEISSTGNGTTFSIRLPLAASSPQR